MSSANKIKEKDACRVLVLRGLQNIFEDIYGADTQAAPTVGSAIVSRLPSIVFHLRSSSPVWLDIPPRLAQFAGHGCHTRSLHVAGAFRLCHGDDFNFGDDGRPFESELVAQALFKELEP